MTLEEKAILISEQGYDHGMLMSYAIMWDCSVSEAIEKLFEKLTQVGRA